MIEKKVRLVYIVDDDEVIKYLTELMFKQMDFCEELVYFKEPAKALEQIRLRKEGGLTLPDFILLDLKMPQINGWEFLEELERLKIRDKMPVFLFSSSINEDDKLRSRSYKIVLDYIIKPLTINKINKILRMLPSD